MTSQQGTDIIWAFGSSLDQKQATFFYITYLLVFRVHQAQPNHPVMQNM